MFGLHRRRCKKYGLHIVRTRRLWIVSARQSDFARYVELASEPVAQHWFGWLEEHMRQGHPRTLAEPFGKRNSQTDVMPPGKPGLFFAAIDPRAGQVIAGMGITPVGSPTPRLEIGGAVHTAFRGRGLGTEALRGSLRLAHKHFGVNRVYAGCERSNVASVRWLTSTGFVPADGPATHVLPNGREIESLWWVRQFPAAPVRCPWLVGSQSPDLPGVGDSVGDDMGDVLVHEGVGDLAPAPLRADDRRSA